MLVTREPIRRDIPHEEGAWIEFCKLSWKQLAKARTAGLVENAEQAKIWGVEWVKALTSDGGAEKAKKIAAAQQWDPSNFGTGALLEFGIVAWSYEQDVEAGSIDEIDGATATWAKQQIIDINKPPGEEEQKKDSGSSSEP